MTETKALLRRYLAPYEEADGTLAPPRKKSDRTHDAVRSSR